MKKKICKDCKGTGDVKGLGFMPRDCQTCEGHGYLYLKPPTVEDPANREKEPKQELIVESKPKRRGRPKKEG